MDTHQPNPRTIRRRSFLLSLATMLACGGSQLCGGDDTKAPKPRKFKPIALKGTKSYETISRKFFVALEEAQEIARAKASWASQHEMICGDYYVFVNIQKVAGSRSGIYVNGYTGEAIEHSDRRLTDLQRRILRLY